MTASEFAEKINTPYPTVAAWLREGRIPGAELQEFGKVKFWMIPVDVLKDFVRPKMGRPTKQKAAVAEMTLAKTEKPSKKAKSSKLNGKASRKRKAPQ